jgi:hypothetical protein
MRRLTIAYACRWQDARLPAGFWGIKDTILIRKAGDPEYQPEWGAWAKEDRNSAQAAVSGHETEDSGRKEEVHPTQTALFEGEGVWKARLSAWASLSSSVCPGFVWLCGLKFALLRFFSFALSCSCDASGKSESPEEKWDLVPTIAGPWMRRWPLVHHNAHTELFGLHDEAKWHKA